MSDLAEAFEKAKQKEKDDELERDVRAYYDGLTKPKIEGDRMVFEREKPEESQAHIGGCV